MSFCRENRVFSCSTLRCLPFLLITITPRLDYCCCRFCKKLLSWEYWSVMNTLRVCRKILANSQSWDKRGWSLSRIINRLRGNPFAYLVFSYSRQSCVRKSERESSKERNNDIRSRANILFLYSPIFLHWLYEYPKYLCFMFERKLEIHWNISAYFLLFEKLCKIIPSRRRKLEHFKLCCYQQLRSCRLSLNYLTYYCVNCINNLCHHFAHSSEHSFMWQENLPSLMLESKQEWRAMCIVSWWCASTSPVWCLSHLNFNKPFSKSFAN